jgi:OOP family OmpA-OmpF porin
MRIRIGLALAAVAALAVGCSAKSLPAQKPRDVGPLQFAADEWRVPAQAVVITDATGTTYKYKTFPYGKALTQSFVKAMPEANTRAKFAGPYDASLISFGGDERIVSAMAPFDRSGLASTADSMRLLGDLHGYGGETPIHQVLVEVHDALANTRQGHAGIVMFSDGLPQDEPAAMVAAKWVVDDYKGKVCFHTVHIGGPEDGKRFLKAIADLTDCGSTRVLADVWSPAGMSKLAHDVFAGPAPPDDPCAGRIVLRGVEFEFDKANLTPDSAVILDVAMEELKRCPKVPMSIEGHTDARGSDSYNQSLGQRRADSVKSYFVSKGLRGGRFRTRSYGESRPIATNDTDEGRQLNRRVELLPQQ